MVAVLYWSAHARSQAICLRERGLQSLVVSTEHPALCKEWLLATGDALVDQDFNLNPTVLSPPGLSLVRCRCSVLAHGAGRNDMPYGHVPLLHEVSDDRFSAVLAQPCVHSSAAGPVGIAHHLEDVSFQASSGFRQLLEFFLVRRRDFGAADIELHGRFALDI